MQRIRELQANPGPEFAIQRDGRGVLKGAHDSLGLLAAFERGSVSVVLGGTLAASASRPFELGVVAWGCLGEMVELPAASPSLIAQRSNAVQYRHGGIDEWYALGPAGLEQGFDVNRLPACAQRGEPLRIQLRFGLAEGEIARLAEDGSEALLSMPGRDSLHYSDFFAADAAGKRHRVQVAQEASLLLVVDVADALLPLHIDPLAWITRTEAIALDGAANDRFGTAVAINDDTALIGSPGDDDYGQDSGSVYQYGLVPVLPPGVGTFWQAQSKLTTGDSAAGDAFGATLTMTDDTAAVGAPGDDDQGADAGSVYVFVRSGNSWTAQQKLLPTDLGAGARFGTALALAGDALLVGAPNAAAERGAAYLFTRSGTTWTLTQKLLPEGNTLALPRFGAAVAIAGSYAAVGRDASTGGRVDWFSRSGATWAPLGEAVTSSVPRFGSALAMTETHTAIGSPQDTLKGAASGSVSVASTPAPNSPLRTVVRPNGAANDRLGSSVAIAGTTLLAGTPGSPDRCAVGQKPPCPPDRGSAVMFSLNGAAWEQQGVFSHSVGKAGEQFGASVALVRRRGIVGAPFHDWAFPDVGGVVMLDYALTGASPCTSKDECLSNVCSEGVCCEFTCLGPCRSCLAALKDPTRGFNGDWATGRCGSVKKDTDPIDGCPVVKADCGTTGACNGMGTCNAPPLGTPCQGESGTLCPTPTSAALKNVCVAANQCGALASECLPGYLCANGACATSCATDAQCDSSKDFKCVAGTCKISVGAACTTHAECETGWCGFGVCCVPDPIYGCATPPGQPCDDDDHCYTHLCLNGLCALGEGGAGGEGGAAGTGADAGTTAGGQATAGGGTGGGGTGGTLAGSGGTAGGGTSGGGTAGGGTSGGGTSGGGAAGAPSSGIGGTLANGGGLAMAGAFPSDAGAPGVECVQNSDCTSGLVCDRDANVCVDQTSHACGCRTAGGKSRPPLASVLGGLLGLVALGRRRRGPHKNITTSDCTDRRQSQLNTETSELQRLIARNNFGSETELDALVQLDALRSLRKEQHTLK